MLRKDQALDQLALTSNVAQFVAFKPTSGGSQITYSRISGDGVLPMNVPLNIAIERLFKSSKSGTVNVRSFIPSDPQAKPFSYGITSPREALDIANSRLSLGLWIIVNETIDINDGGFSGVLEGGLAEFAPKDTPRCVEKPGTCSLSEKWTNELLKIIYQTELDLTLTKGQRYEFSVHPTPQGWLNTNVIGWEIEPSTVSHKIGRPKWPNRYSRFIGDKTFGLLLAHVAGARVPYTTAFVRSPKLEFSFGTPTEEEGVWVRSSPREQGIDAGRFTTIRGWTDPIALLEKQEPSPANIIDPDTLEEERAYQLPSVIVQSAVRPLYSGKTIVEHDGHLLTEGRAGSGEKYMSGEELPDAIPATVKDNVHNTYRYLHSHFGPVEFEWVFDGNHVWVVQLHLGISSSSGNIIVAGTPRAWIKIPAATDLESLRMMVSELKHDEGIVIIGAIGRTSHKADILRRSGRPARIED